jgi:aminopeptidase
MRDQRLDALARILVRYSTRVGEGDLVAIDSDSPASEPLLLAIYEEVLRAGGLPWISMQPTGAAERYFALASDAQLDFVSPVTKANIETADVRINVGAPMNTRELSEVDPVKQKRRAVASRPLLERFMERSASGDLRWVGTAYPTQALAAEANMSLRTYWDMYFDACLATAADPIKAWEQAGAETQRLSDWCQGRSEVHIVGNGTDLKLSVEGRTFVPGLGDHNMPDGEFFTGPVEDSAEGHITFHLPAIHAGRDVSGVRFEFKDGKVVGATADTNEDYLIALLDSDPGARYLGELGIGTNFGITRGTRSILLDEKIGGTVHLAIGASYPETGGTNESAVHWDMICDLRTGGSVTMDGELLQQDGAFVV